MIELSQTTLRVIQHLFTLNQRHEVEHILLSECNHNVVREAGAEWNELRERIQLGALKVSNGSIDKLYTAIILAQTDWRDLLMAAGFGHSVTEHKDWAQVILKA